MSFRYLENVLSRQDNSKTILRYLEDVLCRLGSCADITYFISGLGAVDRHLNATPKKENNTERCPYILSSDVS